MSPHGCPSSPGNTRLNCTTHLCCPWRSWFCWPFTELHSWWRLHQVQSRMAPQSLLAKAAGVTMSLTSPCWPSLCRPRVLVKVSGPSLGGEKMLCCKLERPFQEMNGKDLFQGQDCPLPDDTRAVRSGLTHPPARVVLTQLGCRAAPSTAHVPAAFSEKEQELWTATSPWLCSTHLFTSRCTCQKLAHLLSDCKK